MGMLLDLSDKLPCPPQGTGRLPFAYATISIICSMSELLDDIQVSGEKGRIQLAPPEDLIGKGCLESSMCPLGTDKPYSFKSELRRLVHGVVGSTDRGVIET